MQPEYESSTSDEELLELQEQNFRLQRQQQQLEMEAAAQQEAAAQAQPVGLRERIGFVGAGQARGAVGRATLSDLNTCMEAGLPRRCNGASARRSQVRPWTKNEAVSVQRRWGRR